MEETANRTRLKNSMQRYLFVASLFLRHFHAIHLQYPKVGEDSTWSEWERKGLKTICKIVLLYIQPLL